MAPIHGPIGVGGDGSGGGGGGGSAFAVADINRDPASPQDTLRFAKNSWSEEWDIQAQLRALAEQASFEIAGSAGTLTVEADTSWLVGTAGNGQELGFRERGTSSPASFASADLPTQAGATAARITLGGLEFYTDEDEHNPVAYNGIEITIDVASGHTQHNSQWFPTPRDLTINVPTGETNAQFVEFWSTRTFGSAIESLRVRLVSGMGASAVTALTGEVTGGINSTAGIRVSFSRGTPATYGDLGNAFRIQTQTETAPITNVNSSVTVSGIQFSGSGAGDGTHYDGWQIIINAPSGASMALAVNANARTVTCTPATGSTIQQAFTDWSALVNANAGRVFDTIQNLILTVVGTAGDPIASGSGTMAGGVDAAPGTNPSFTLAGSVFTLVQNPTSTIADLRALMNGHTGITTATYGATPTGPVSGDIMFTGGENAEYAPDRELVPPHAEAFIWATNNNEEIGARIRFVPSDSDWVGENVAGTAGNAWTVRITHDPTQTPGTVGFVVNLSTNEIGLNTNPNATLLTVIQGLENNAIGRYTVDRIGAVTGAALRVSAGVRNFSGGENGIIGKVRIRNGDTWQQIRALIDADSRFNATLAPPNGTTTIASLVASTGTEQAFADGVNAQLPGVVENASARRVIITYHHDHETLGDLRTMLQDAGFSAWYRRNAGDGDTPEPAPFIRQVGPITTVGGANSLRGDAFALSSVFPTATVGNNAGINVSWSFLDGNEWPELRIVGNRIFLLPKDDIPEGVKGIIAAAEVDGEEVMWAWASLNNILNLVMTPSETSVQSFWINCLNDGGHGIAGVGSAWRLQPRGNGTALPANLRVRLYYAMEAGARTDSALTRTDVENIVSEVGGTGGTALFHDTVQLSGDATLNRSDRGKLVIGTTGSQVIQMPPDSQDGDNFFFLGMAPSDTEDGIDFQFGGAEVGNVVAGEFGVLIYDGTAWTKYLLSEDLDSATIQGIIDNRVQPLGRFFLTVAAGGTVTPDRDSNGYVVCYEGSADTTITLSNLSGSFTNWRIIFHSVNAQTIIQDAAGNALQTLDAGEAALFYRQNNNVAWKVLPFGGSTSSSGTGLTIQQSQLLDELVADPHGRELLDRITAQVIHEPGAQITGIRIGLSAGIRDANTAISSIGTGDSVSTGAGVNLRIDVGATNPSLLAGNWIVQATNASNQVVATFHKHQFLRIINASDRVVYETALQEMLGANLTLRVHGATISLTKFGLEDGSVFGDVTTRSGTNAPGDSERILGTVVLYARRGTSGSFESLHLHAGGSDDSWQTLATSGGGSLTVDALLDLFKETREVADRNKVLAIAADNQNMLALRTIIGAAADDIIDIRPMQPLYMKNTGTIPSIINLGAYAATTSTSGGYVLWSTRPTGWSVSEQSPDAVNNHEWVLPAWQVRTRQGWQTTSPTIILGHVTLEDIFVSPGDDESARVWIDALTDQATFERQAPTFVGTGSTIDAAAAAPLLANEPFDSATIPASGIAILSLSLPVGSLLQVIVEPNAGTVGDITIQTRSSADTATIIQTFTVTAAQQTSGAAVNLAITTAANQIVITASSTGAALISAVHALRLSSALSSVSTDNQTITGLGTPTNPIHIANLFAIPAWVSGTSYAQGAFTRVATTIYIKSSVGTGTTNDPSTTQGRSEWAVLASLVPLAATLTDDGYRNLEPTWTTTINLAASQANGAVSTPKQSIPNGPPDGASHLLVTFSLATSLPTSYNFALRFDTTGGGQSSLHDEEGGNAYIQAGGGIQGRIPVDSLLNGNLSVQVFYHDGSPADVTGAAVTVTAVPQHRVTITGRTRNVYGADLDTIEEGEIVTTDGDTAVTNPTWNYIRFDRAILWTEIDFVWIQWSASSGASGDRWILMEGLAWERMGRVAAGATYNIPTAGATRINGFIFGGVSDGDDVLQQVPKIQPTYFHVNYPLTQGSHVFMVIPEAAEHQSLYCIGFRLAVFAPAASYRRPALWKVDVRRIEGGR